MSANEYSLQEQIYEALLIDFGSVKRQLAQIMAVVAAHDAQVREESLNAGVVLAALDGMLEPWTLQKDAEISSMKYRIRRLRDQVAQYVPALPVPSTGTEEVEPKFEIPGFEGTNELLAKLTIRTEGEN